MEFMTIKEAMTAHKVGYHTLYRAVKSGEIEAYKPGRTLFLDAASLEAWFRGKKVQPRKPIGRPRKYDRRAVK